MAQTGYTPIQLYRTTTAAATPLAANLNAGELAINYNTADMSVWALNTGGSVVRLMNNPAGLKYPTADGTSNQVIKTDGAGLLSWVTAVLSGGALGTPTSGTLTNCTGLPISTGVSGLGTNVATFLQTPSSTNLAAALTDETGTAGKVVFDTNPTFPAQINLTANSGYNIYASGTAGNYLAGSLGIGGVPVAGYKVLNYGTWTGGTTFYGYSSQGNIQSDVTSISYSYISAPNTAAASFTLSNLVHYASVGGVVGAGSSISIQSGFTADVSLTGATNNYGFYGGIASGANRYNLYMAGTAPNYLAGKLGIGTVSTTGESFRVGYTADTTATVYGIREVTVVNQATTTVVYSVASQTNILSPAALTSLSRFYAAQGSFTGTLTNQSGFTADVSLTGATNNYGFYGSIASGANRYNLYMAGTADNAFSGDVSIFGAGKLGYTTGSGGAVTQGTSRTTGVTLNKTNGAITLVSAAGLATYQSFTVTNSTVVATDTIIVNQKSGTDKYIILVTNVAAGSFQITFATTGGLTTEQPVFNYALIKAVNA